MKTNLVLKNIEIAGAKIGEVAIEQEYSVSEILKLANGGKNFVKELLKDLPEMLADFKKSMDYIDSVEKEEEYDKEKETLIIVNEYLEGILNATSLDEVSKIVGYAYRNGSVYGDNLETILITAEKKKSELRKTEVKFFDKCMSAIKNSTSISEVDSIIHEAGMSTKLSFEEMLTISATASRRRRQLLK